MKQAFFLFLALGALAIAGAASYQHYYAAKNFTVPIPHPPGASRL